MKRLTLLVSSLTIALGLSAQKDLVISGGNSVASLVCGNQDVYVAGSNKVEGIVGTLGTGNTSSEKISTWTKVNFPADASGDATTMKQVNSGSGSFFIALDCKGQAWGWGNNLGGQTGTGKSDQGVTTPAQVKAGEAANIAGFNDGHGNLAGVSVVYAGNEVGYAIMNDGRLMAWGAGKNWEGDGGLIGNGASNNCPTPVFVKTSNGQHLQNVISVFAGDNGALALVDPDGDGVGTVYSWGTGANGTLGRNANGSLWTQNEVGLYAAPVMKEAGKPLDNIVAIACGDVFGVALDVDGYVWTWGNHGWNKCCGWDEWRGNMGVPWCVSKGSTTGDSNDGTYLLAKAIGAGQCSGMAITADGKPVLWGMFNPNSSEGGDNPPNNNASCGTNNGTDGTPRYVEWASGKVHNDVILINKGDNWGYYGRSDGTMWAWGGNMNGTMGNGGTTGVGNATQISIASSSGCTFKDPPPTAKLPASKTVCASAYASETLNCGFVAKPD